MATIAEREARRRQKDMDRLLKKKEKFETKLDKLEARHRAGKVQGPKYHDKKIELRRQIAAFDKAARKVKGRASSK